MKFRNIFWGVILIFAGVLFILQNMGLIYFDWVSLWRLWPVILVLWGVSIIPVNNWIKIILVLLILGGSVSFMLNKSVYWGDHNRRWDLELFNDNFNDDDDENIDESNRRYTTQTFNIPYDDSSKYVQLKLEAAAGKFIISEKSDNLLEFARKGNSAEYSYSIRSLDSNSVIDIQMENASVNLGKNHKNLVNLALNEIPKWDINLEAGAASVDFDLKEYYINKLVIEGGAASIKIDLGNKSKLTHLNIEAGASSIEIKIPESSGCLLNLDSVFSGKKIQGFDKTDHGKYKTSNFDEAVNKVYIDAETAVSSFTIIRY